MPLPENNAASRYAASVGHLQNRHCKTFVKLGNLRGWGHAPFKTAVRAWRAIHKVNFFGRDVSRAVQ